MAHTKARELDTIGRVGLFGQGDCIHTEGLGLTTLCCFHNRIMISDSQCSAKSKPISLHGNQTFGRLPRWTLLEEYSSHVPTPPRPPRPLAPPPPPLSPKSYERAPLWRYVSDGLRDALEDTKVGFALMRGVLFWDEPGRRPWQHRCHLPVFLAIAVRIALWDCLVRTALWQCLSFVNLDEYTTRRIEMCAY